VLKCSEIRRSRSPSLSISPRLTVPPCSDNISISSNKSFPMFLYKIVLVQNSKGGGLASNFSSSNQD